MKSMLFILFFITSWTPYQATVDIYRKAFWITQNGFKLLFFSLFYTMTEPTITLQQQINNLIIIHKYNDNKENSTYWLNITLIKSTQLLT